MSWNHTVLPIIVENILKSSCTVHIMISSASTPFDKCGTGKGYKPNMLVFLFNGCPVLCFDPLLDPMWTTSEIVLMVVIHHMLAIIPTTIKFLYV